MKLFTSKLVVSFVLIACATTAFAQFHPLPASDKENPAICTACQGLNSSGQPNADLPTYPYSAPVAKFIGRYVDSTSTQDYQNVGMRTARAERIQIAPTQRGSAPPRVYIRLGSTLAAYNLDTFFTTRLPDGMKPVNSISTGGDFSRHTPMEKVCTPDGWVYAEAKGSGWTTVFMDGQDRLGEFDYDDRGYVYLAYSVFGWGIVKDSGETGGKKLPLVKQMSAEDITPWTIFSLKTGGKYFTIVSNYLSARSSYGAGHKVFDVTDPQNPVQKDFLTGIENGIWAWAKDDASQRVAIIDGHGDLSIYSYADYVNGRSPIATFNGTTNKGYVSVTADDSGNFYAVQGDKIINSNVSKIVAAGSTYRDQPLSPFTAPFAPENIHYGDKYLIVTGRETVGSKNTFRMYMFRTTTTGLDPIDDRGFFQKYYHLAPSGYAEPYKEATLRDATMVKSGGKSYLLFSSDKLGDVFEIQAGDTVSASVKNTTFGTANPYTEGGPGPYYGDILTFKSVGSNTTWIYNVEWNFGNSENGADNTKLSKTGNEVTYQYNNLNTAAKITQQKTVTVEVTNDPSISDSVKVDLQLPAPRVGVKQDSSILATANGASFDVIAGDEFIDASDGVVEGHYGVWEIGTASTTILPNQTVPVGDVGTHTLKFTTKYGRYDGTLTSIGTPYSTSLSNITYDVRPFVVSLRPPTKNTTNVTFSGASRISSVASMFTAQNWSVTWTLKNGGTDIVPPQTTTEAKGVIPNFQVPVATTIPSGSIVTLTVSVLPAEVNAPTGYETATDSMELSTPNPQMTVGSGCSNTGETCALTVSSLTGASMADWTYSWAVKNGTSTVKSGTTNPLSFAFTNPGTYTATVTVTKGIFSVPVTKTITVAGPICGPPPSANEVAIGVNCSDCAVGQTITFSRELWGYSDQTCNTYSWNFGDGSPAATGTEVTHSYSTKKTYTVTLTVKTTSNAQTSTSTTVQVGGGTQTETCTLPTGVTATYVGTSGCAPGTSCTTAESVRFTANRTGGIQSTCDTISWNFDDGTPGSNKASISHTFTSQGSYDPVVTITNSRGSAQATVHVVVVPGSTGGSCASVANETVYFEYHGASSNCSLNGSPCSPGEQIQFTALGWQYEFQTCDKFEWDFGDGSALSTERNPVHVMQGSSSSYNVKLRVWNTASTTGVSEAEAVVMGVPAKPTPVLNYSPSFPHAGAKGKEITFTVNSNIDQTTGWKWTFGDNTAADSSQATVISKSNTIKHTYTKTGTFTVKVSARNAEDSASAPTGTTQDTIVITDEPEYRYLLPVVVHAGGQFGSVWRTDVQVYNPDPNVSANNALDMTATFKGRDLALHIVQSTFIYKDFMTILTTGDDSGPVIITTKAKYPPQIWTRTYNQAANGGTFGQFIPAIPLDGAGGGSANTESVYYLAGLRHDSRYRTNLGFVNPTNAPISATVTVYDDRRLGVGQFTKVLDPLQLVQFPITSEVPTLSADRPFSVEVKVPAGQWVIAYASYIDSVSNDPVFIQAVNENDLSSSDYRNNVIPGVGHITQSDGSWRSDVTIFNPDNTAVQFDLQYFNSAGQKLAEAPGIVIKPLEFMQFTDLLKEGTLGNVPDGLGIIRINASTPLPNNRYPMTFARTYFDRGAAGSFGQGIGGFSNARANVKPGAGALIPAVRSDDDYYTNIGVTNVGDVTATVTVTLLDPTTGGPGPQQQFTLAPNQSILGQFNFGSLHEGTMKVETTAGSVWAFASVIDRRTKDPEYVPGIPLQ